MSSVRSIRALACALVLFTAMSAPAVAQTTGLIMQIQSQKGGTFPGESTRSPNGIPLRAWTYSAEIPVDKGGTPTGPRRYAPISFEKPFGNASPEILKAMLSGEPLTITVDVIGVSATGTPVLIHRVTFNQARILSIARKSTADASDRATSSNLVTAETVTFDFRVVEFDPGRSSGSIVDEIEMR